MMIRTIPHGWIRQPGRLRGSEYGNASSCTSYITEDGNKHRALQRRYGLRFPWEIRRISQMENV